MLQFVFTDKLVWEIIYKIPKTTLSVKSFIQSLCTFSIIADAVVNFELRYSL